MPIAVSFIIESTAASSESENWGEHALVIAKSWCSDASPLYLPIARENGCHLSIIRRPNVNEQETASATQVWGSQEGFDTTQSSPEVIQALDRAGLQITHIEYDPIRDLIAGPPLQDTLFLRYGTITSTSHQRPADTADAWSTQIEGAFKELARGNGRCFHIMAEPPSDPLKAIWILEIWSKAGGAQATYSDQALMRMANDAGLGGAFDPRAVWEVLEYQLLRA